jgi:hypothetical protein
MLSPSPIGSAGHGGDGAPKGSGMKRFFCASFVAVMLVAPASRAQWSAEAEGGRAWAEYIDVRIPGDTGTKFSLTDSVYTFALIHHAAFGVTARF